MDDIIVPRGSKVCIICHQQVSSGNAAKVREDVVIRSIRSIKKMLNISQNNELFVCEKDLETHKGKRKKFEKEFSVICAFAVMLVLLLNGLPLLGGRFELGTFISSIVIAALILLFAIVFKYAPAADAASGTVPSGAVVPKDLQEKKTAVARKQNQKYRKGENRG